MSSTRQSRPSPEFGVGVNNIGRSLIISKETKPGRKVMCRMIQLDGGDAASSDRDDNNARKACAELLFVHGSCACSSQFDALIDNLGEHFSARGIDTEGKDAKKANNGHATMACHLYDSYGCGESRMPDDKLSWSDVSEEELSSDLRAIFSSILSQSGTDDDGRVAAPVFLIAHSYGTSQVIKLLTDIPIEERDRVAGIVLIGGALKGGAATSSSNDGDDDATVANVTKDGGHWIFRLPVPVLNWMQPSLSAAFVNAAFHPSCSDRALLDEALRISNANSMKMCKAFYRQKTWATVDDANSLKVKALVIHGEDDMVVPLSGGRCLHKSLADSEIVVVPQSSHQVFEEHPKVVSDHILKFVLDGIQS